VIESLRFVTPSTMKAFGIASESDAELMRPWAFNQGFYNLFLAIIAATGVVLFGVGADASSIDLVGRTLIFAGVAPMLAAAIVLIASDPTKARAAGLQALFPAITIGALAVSALI
jgi:putative membrane protein